MKKPTRAWVKKAEEDHVAERESHANPPVHDVVVFIASNASKNT